MATSETSVEPHDRPTVSIVIPAFNEASRIGDSLQKIGAFLARTPSSVEVTEIIVVDDGSSDATSSVASNSQVKLLKLLHNNSNHGKGYSVRQGVLNARGTYVLFTDADLSAPIEELNKLFAVAIGENADIVIGSRAVDRKTIEIHQARFRELGGILFNRMVRMLLGLDLKDTQCGFKLFHRERTIAIFEKQTTYGFGFDPEILYVAARRGLSIREVPVRWSHADGSKVNFMRDGTRMFMDLARIRWNYLIGRYS